MPPKIPPNLVGFIEHVSQKAEALCYKGIAKASERACVKDPHDQEIARLGAFNIDRPCERVDRACIYIGNITSIGSIPYLSIQGIERLYHDLVARAYLNSRLYIGVPSIVTNILLVCAPLVRRDVYLNNQAGHQVFFVTAI